MNLGGVDIATKRVWKLRVVAQWTIGAALRFGRVVAGSIRRSVSVRIFVTPPKSAGTQAHWWCLGVSGWVISILDGNQVTPGPCLRSCLYSERRENGQRSVVLLVSKGKWIGGGDTLKYNKTRINLGHIEFFVHR